MSNNTNGHGNLKRLTGKQASFVDKYLGEARFNASLAAKLAGYKATSKHSFEAIGSENLTKPAIAKTIQEYWRVSRMSSDEVIKELSDLARSEIRDNVKLRALALLSAHFGLLDGSGGPAVGRGGTDIVVRYETHLPPKVTKDEWSVLVRLNKEIEDAIIKVYGENSPEVGEVRTYNTEDRQDRIAELVAMEKQLRDYNEKLSRHNEHIASIWSEMFERFKDSPDAVAALTELRERAMQSEMSPEWEAVDEPKAIEPEIIPPDRRLQPAAVERLMREVEARTVTPEAHNALVVVHQPDSQERVRPYGYCQRVDPEELERIKEHDERRRSLRLY